MLSNMTGKPGISRDERISDTGLQRLRDHLQRGAKISKPVLRQWVKRYGDDAIALLAEFGIQWEE